MSDSKIVAHDKLSEADLVVDAVYEGGTANNLSAAPLPDLMGVGTNGGFRPKRSPTGARKYAYVVLYTTFDDPDWPDHLNPQTGIFTYYGDNKSPGSTIHDKTGNKILRDVFEDLHAGNRSQIPPFFVFSRGEGWNRQFRGIAVPGDKVGTQSEDLVAVWKHNGGQRFQNYRARFTILDVDRIPREWIDDLQDGNVQSEHAPDVFRSFKQTGTYQPLLAAQTVQHRTKAEQLPQSEHNESILEAICNHWDDETDGPRRFEYVAAAIFELMDSNVHTTEITRQSRDGGRDAVGTYQIGPDIGAGGDSLGVEFALEAKYYQSQTGVGVRETSRLISRLRHRQFGVLVTTSYVGEQAYKEIKRDGHPVLVLSGGDIVEILVQHGVTSVGEVRAWLESQVPA